MCVLADSFEKNIVHCYYNSLVFYKDRYSRLTAALGQQTYTVTLSGHQNMIRTTPSSSLSDRVTSYQGELADCTDMQLTLNVIILFLSLF